MNKTSIYLLAGAAALLAGTGITIAVHAQGQSAVAAPAAPGAPQPSALVRVQPLQLRTMHASISAYGDVLPGRTEAISSAALAQLSRLNVMLGQSVRKGQVLAVLEADPSVQLAYAQAQTARTLAEAELQRVTGMAQMQLATQSQVDAAHKALRDAQAAVQAQQALGGAHGGQTVTAPDNGVITALSAFQGDRVQPGVPFMQIGTTRELKVVLGVDPADQAAVHSGMRVSLDALGGQGAQAQAWSGTVQEVQRMLDPKTQLVNVVVRVPASAGLLPGARVHADIALASRSAYAVPRQAVLSDDGGSYVFQVAQQHARRIAVQQVAQLSSDTLGIADAPAVPAATVTTAALNKLDPALPLVVLGNYELSDGMTVRTQP